MGGYTQGAMNDGVWREGIHDQQAHLTLTEMSPPTYTHTTRTHYNIIMLHFTPHFVPSTPLYFSNHLYYLFYLLHDLTSSSSSSTSSSSSKSSGCSPSSVSTSSTISSVISSSVSSGERDGVVECGATLEYACVAT